MNIAYDPSSPELASLAPAEVRERWAGADRASHEPRLVVATADDGAWIGAALVSARPGTAYLKIVDAVGDAAAAVRAVVETATAEGRVQVKWEGWSVDDAAAAASGFRPLRAPISLADAAGQPPVAYVRWLGDADPREPGYYRQSTDFSCGAVTALIARTTAEGTASFDRTEELSLWREATNFNACEPFGLAVAVHGAWPGAAVSVALDVDRPVLLDHLNEAESDWRAVLQTAAKARAIELGLPIDGARLGIPDLRAAIDDGEDVLLLVSLGIMQGFAVPHWVLAHGTVDGAVVIEDPWFRADIGDTWVDAHLLPVADDRLDEMARIEHDDFRGAVRIASR